MRVRVGSRTCVWQMSQQGSWSVADSLGYRPAQSICLSYVHSSEFSFFLKFICLLWGVMRTGSGEWSLDEGVAVIRGEYFATYVHTYTLTRCQFTVK